MTPEYIIGVVVTIVISVIGYLLKRQDDAAEKRIAELETTTRDQITQQARDEVKWDNQSLINVEVKKSIEDTAVLKSQVNQIHHSIDELKTDFKDFRSDFRDFINEWKKESKY